MNSRNRHMQYRRSVYRRRQIRLGLILSVVIAAVLLLAFLIVGNLLFGRATPEEPTPTPNAPNNTPDEREPVPAVKARTVFLETSDSSTFSSRIRALINDGATAASIPLTASNGALLYRSSVGEQIGYPTSGAPTVRISSAVAQVEEQQIHLSGVFYLTAFSKSDPLLRSVELSRSVSVIAEAILSGVDDILLIAPDCAAEQVDEVLRLAEDIRVLAPNATVGFALPSSVLTDEKAAELIDRLWNGLDFLALNASEYGSESPVEYAKQMVEDPNMQFNRLRYHMRVLLPSCGDDSATRDSVISAMEADGVDNWQIVS